VSRSASGAGLYLAWLGAKLGFSADCFKVGPSDGDHDPLHLEWVYSVAWSPAAALVAT
jgi:hypothetical protein